MQWFFTLSECDTNSSKFYLLIVRYSAKYSTVKKAQSILILCLVLLALAAVIKSGINCQVKFSVLLCDVCCIH